MNPARRAILWAMAASALLFLTHESPAADGPIPSGKVGERLPRTGDEIVVCGQYFHTTTPVVLWTDPGGYDAYRTERRFVPLGESSWEETAKAIATKKSELKAPNRFSLRKADTLSPETVERVRGGGWSLEDLQGVVDQFVIHFDVAGTSKRCFQTLHDQRGLSVHFMLDQDGTIYQTLDLKERAWHATIANTRSVGIEISNIGAYADKGGGPGDDPAVLAKWYPKGPDGKTVLTIPGGAAQAGERHPELTLRPARDEPIIGQIHGKTLRQYDFTPQQYAALTKLTATLCTVFPKLKCDYPRDSSGKLITRRLVGPDYDNYHGVLGHFHVQDNKVDPGPAFQWDTVIDGARSLMKK
jgi:N-acetyl-anhydromuramyl-L-alanine amidase AmpD